MFVTLELQQLLLFIWIQGSAKTSRKGLGLSLNPKLILLTFWGGWSLRFHLCADNARHQLISGPWFVKFNNFLSVSGHKARGREINRKPLYIFAILKHQERDWELVFSLAVLLLQRRTSGGILTIGIASGRRWLSVGAEECSWKSPRG